MIQTKIKDQKQALRDSIQEKLKNITRAERLKKSEVIRRKLTRLKIFRRAEVLCAFVGLPSEVSTKEIIREALYQKKSVCVPKVADGKCIELYQIENIKRDLKPGTFGIEEPWGAKKKVDPATVDLILVPGIAFNLSGKRLGRGSGYYDRFLKQAKRAKRVGLAFSEQLSRNIPVDTHDLLMDQVITDK